MIISLTKAEVVAIITDWVYREFKDKLGLESPSDVKFNDFHIDYTEYRFEKASPMKDDEAVFKIEST
jgi:hypothetical protein